MKQNVNFSQFCDSFSDTYKDHFSYAGKRALFDYLEDIVDNTGEEYTLDTVALVCEYMEYETAWDAMYQYQPEDMPVEGKEGDDLVEIQEKNEKKAHEWLEEHTQVIDVEGGRVIIQQF